MDFMASNETFFFQITFLCLASKTASRWCSVIDAKNIVYRRAHRTEIRSNEIDKFFCIYFALEMHRILSLLFFIACFHEP